MNICKGNLCFQRKRGGHSVIEVTKVTFTLTPFLVYIQRSLVTACCTQSQLFQMKKKHGDGMKLTPGEPFYFRLTQC